MIGLTAGKYRVEERIGRGGMGTVYRATDETLHREVALKVLNAELNDPEVARRFRAEAVTVARLSHPGIATIYELFQHDGQWLMVMEFVRGETLERLVTRTGPLPAHRTAELCMQALAGLAHAHNLGVVHRDLKPANLMINDTGAVKIMDFGIARVSGSEHLTNAGFMMGTPAYMAPEQVLGGEVDQRADLYAMGVVFYRLATGKLPFKGDTAFAMAQSQVNDPPTPVMLARPDLPAWVESLVGRALAKAPGARFQSAAEFHDALARSLAGMPPRVAHDDGSAPTELMATPTRTPLAMPRVSETPPRLDAPVPVAAEPTPAAGAGRMGPRNRKNWMGGVAAVVAAVAVLAVLAIAGRIWLRSGDVTPAAPAAGETRAALAPVAPPPADPPPAAPVAAATEPTAAKAPAASGPPPSAARSAVPSGAASGATTPPPATARSAAPPTAAASARGAEPPPAPAATDELVGFTNVKFLAVNGRRTNDRDVLVNFGGGQITVLPRDGGAAIAAVPYRRIRRATYVNARDPKWDPALAAPPADLDVGTFLRQSRHWLVVQTADAYAILRLDDRQVTRLLQTLEARVGIKVDRPAQAK